MFDQLIVFEAVGGSMESNGMETNQNKSMCACVCMLGRAAKRSRLLNLKALPGPK